MSSQPIMQAGSAAPHAAAKTDWFRVAVLSGQTFFGAWFLIHGLNHWVHFFPQPPGSDSLTSQLIRVMIDTGLFDLIKGGEIVSGILLLTHRFVPLGIVLAVPPAVVIAYINYFLNKGAESFATATVILVILALMGVGYIKSFKPLFRPTTDEPTADCLNELKTLFR
ncbi:hypothetical protein [Sphingobium sp. LB126]|uniref:hypothetical protein n=1 Tax=Sphingobium sp. LB126 TaxID=1983755 RepID=UPI0012FD139F|nr:hypothetical protein [Sphingobium sp. LB126]